MRTRVINDFCRKIAKFKFIVESEALQIFLIKSIDVNKVIGNLPKLSYEEILLRYKKAFPYIKVENKENFDKEKLEIKNWIPLLKKVSLNLSMFKDNVTETMINKEKEANYYFDLMNVFEDYEKYVLMEFKNNNEDKLIFYNPKNSEAFDKIMNLKDKFINPFKQLCNWLEDDILDFEAMINTLEQIINLYDLIEKLKNRLVAINEESNECKDNDVSFFSWLFKWKNKENILSELEEEKEKTQKNIEDITELSIISTRLTLEHLKIFRIEKLQRYHKYIKKFSETHKDNNEIINDLWNYISKDPKLHDKDKDLDS